MVRTCVVGALRLATLVAGASACADVWQFEELHAGQEDGAPESQAWPQSLDAAGVAPSPPEAAPPGAAALEAGPPTNASVEAGASASLPDAAAAASDDAACSHECPMPCPASHMECSGRCVNPKDDASNCGACGTTCAAGKRCHQGVCSR
jgi:hypothetical protein